MDSSVQKILFYERMNLTNSLGEMLQFRPRKEAITGLASISTKTHLKRKNRPSWKDMELRYTFLSLWHYFHSLLLNGVAIVVVIAYVSGIIGHHFIVPGELPPEYCQLVILNTWQYWVPPTIGQHYL